MPVAATAPVPAAVPAPGGAAVPMAGWEQGLDAEAQAMLAAGQPDVWDALSRRFESHLILTALSFTRGRRIEAAQKLGIGRNTITRKIAELGLDQDDA
jgi:two-component system nitrogen regulation response regulator GlnG